MDVTKATTLRDSHIAVQFFPDVANSFIVADCARRLALGYLVVSRAWIKKRSGTEVTDTNTISLKVDILFFEDPVLLGRQI